MPTIFPNTVLTLFLSILLLIDNHSHASGWDTWGADKAGSRYSNLQQINRETIDRLQPVWQYQTGAVASHSQIENENAGFQVNPILLPKEAGQHLVTCTPFNRIVAIDPVNGAERWTFDPQTVIHGYGNKNDPRGKKSVPYSKCRGVSFWQDKESKDKQAHCSQRIISGTNDLKIIAIDAISGKVCEDFGVQGVVNAEPLAMAKQPAWPGEVKFYQPPAIINDTLVIGTSVRDNHRVNAPSGAIRAFSVRSGELLWQFDPIPRDPNDPEYQNWDPKAATETGGANTWGGISVDEQRDLVFLPTSGPSVDFYGGNRPGDNRYSDSIVALRGSTGEVVWHFQLIHHDVWDYDVGAQPVLVELSKEGEPFPAVIQATKTGMIYIFHRETGTPYFPIEERAVPQDGVPGELLSPTQPFPTAPPPLVPHGSSKDDFWAPLKGKCEEKYGSARFGPIFTPPSLEGTIVEPSTAGGINWGSVAIDKTNKILVTNVNRAQHFVQLIPNEKISSKADDSGEFKVGEPRPLHGTPYHLKQGPVMSPYYAPCTEPPWAELVAVDIEQGKILWQSPLGTLDKLAPVPIPLKWGTPTFGGPMVTAGGLVFIGATADNRIRAFDLSTGEEVWEFELATGAFTLPMSYEINGVQYIVVAAGGHPFIYRRPGDFITAFALGEPQSVWDRLLKLFN
ncbi:pyrroloquinoline quinone-dependent dehydrogenase [Oceanicoccus sagamiensis]|uniref:Pyrrolo-quinoline quinone repeat domain-containing protein n=1 Tax=Oceanicoccus sagamiensis TaxID=716816 RepID=A0A1X9NG34_9GAMM|nr:pyrroloquinoline quinone-dependent dehydrogenase [Oceanicoccus sagamiensis]ARN76456.1 hypothetical protein BST96_16205 [Oceanicoccus sagamiensis]